MGQRAVRVGILVALVIVAAACDWTTVGFDASRSGFNPVEIPISTSNVGSLTQKWKAALGTGRGSEPVAAGGKVFVTGDTIGTLTSATLQSFDARGITGCTGAAPAICAPLWSESYPPLPTQIWGPNLSAPTVSGAHVFVGLLTEQSGGSYSGMSAYAANTGAHLFGTGLGGLASPAVTGGRIYASVTDIVRPIPFQDARYLAAFDAATGAEQFVATSDINAAYSTPAVANGVLYATTGARLDAFDAAGVTNCSTATPYGWEGAVSAPKFCSPLWSASLPNGTSSPAVANGRVYVTDAVGQLRVFPAAGCGAPMCTATWSATAGTQSLSSVAVTGDRVFVGSDDGHLYAFPALGCGAATCPSSWTASFGGAVATPSVAASLVFVGSKDGHLKAFDANGCGQHACASVWNTTVGTPITSAPTVSDGRVFVTDTAGTLHAYGL
jgi:PQQ-like domain